MPSIPQIYNTNISAYEQIDSGAVGLTDGSNRLTAGQLYNLAQITSSTIPSGFTNISDLDYTYMSVNPNTIKFLSDSVAFVNGYKITVPSGTIITLDAPPVDIARDDLVFLEMWLSQTTGLPQYRLRIVDGIDFTTYIVDGFTKRFDSNTNNDLNIYPQGGNVSPINTGNNNDKYVPVSATSISAYSLGSFIQDVGLYIAGRGTQSSKNALITLDGYVYAVPMFKVHRRASTGYHQTGEYSKFSPLITPLNTQRIIDGTQISHTGDNSVQVQVNGNTLVNLLGSAGNCEDISKWISGASTLDSNIKLFGNSSIRIVGTGSVVSIIKDVTTDSTHKYLLSSYSYISSYTSSTVYTQVTDGGTWNNPIVVNFDTTKLNQWQRKSMIVTGKSAIRVAIACTYATFNTDGVMLYDLTAIYGAGSEPSDIPTLEAQLPFVDGVQSSKPISIKSRGKNLVRSGNGEEKMTGWISSSNTTANIGVGFFDGTYFNVKTNGAELIQWIPVKPNTSYSFSFLAKSLGAVNGSAVIYSMSYKDETMARNQLSTACIVSQFLGVTGLNSTEASFSLLNFITPANAKYLAICIYGNDSINYFGVRSIQLEEGSIATTYVPYKVSQVITPSGIFTDLKKIGAVSDQIDLVRKKHVKKISDWVILDGSWTWNYSHKITGRHEVALAVSNVVANTSMMIKNDGTSLPSSIGDNSYDTQYINANPILYVRISITDSGWVDSYTPTSSEIKAYFYGWKMCMSDGSTWDGIATKYWKKITDGTGVTSTLPTGSYSGYTPYKMIYQLATPIETDISDKLKGRLYVNGSETFTFETEQISSQVVQPVAQPNLVSNGDFSNGTTGWSAICATHSVSSNILSNTGDGSTNYPYETQNGTLVVGHKYYVSSTLRVTNSICVTIGYKFDNNIIYSSINTPIQNQWYKNTGIVSATSTSMTYRIHHNYVDNATANGQIMQIQQAYAIDLTALFGASNEPSQSWCDQYLEFGTNYIVKTPTGTTALGTSRNGKDAFTSVNANVALIPASKYQTGLWEVFYREAPETHVPIDMTTTIGSQTLSLTNKATVGSLVLGATDVGYRRTSEGAYKYNTVSVISSSSDVVGSIVTKTLSSADVAKIKIGDKLVLVTTPYYKVVDINTTTNIVSLLVLITTNSSTNTLIINQRNDLLLADIVDTRDITNLRHMVSLTGFNFSQILEQSFESLLRGEL